MQIKSGNKVESSLLFTAQYNLVNRFYAMPFTEEFAFFFCLFQFYDIIIAHWCGYWEFPLPAIRPAFAL